MCTYPLTNPAKSHYNPKHRICSEDVVTRFLKTQQQTVHKKLTRHETADTKLD
jgi:hypothetical protein